MGTDTDGAATAWPPVRVLDVEQAAGVVGYLTDSTLEPMPVAGMGANPLLRGLTTGRDRWLRRASIRHLLAAWQLDIGCPRCGGKAQSAYRFVNDLKIVLPVLTLLLLALGIYVARRHRRALIGAGLGVAASMLVLGAGLLVFRSVYLNTVPASVLPSDAAAAIFDTLVRFIRVSLRALLVAGLVVAAGAFFTGPSTTAVQTRRATSRMLASLRRAGGVEPGPTARWTYGHRRSLRIGSVCAAALLFVFWGHPTALVVILITVLLLVALALIEIVGRPPASVVVVSQGPPRAT